MEKISDETLVTLLEDEDSHTSMVAMELALQQEDTLRFVMAHQDDENPRLRRRVQQLNNLLHLQEDKLHFVKGLKTKSLTFWDALRYITVIFDERYNLASLDMLVADFLETTPLRHQTTDALVRLMKKGNFETPKYQRMFELETFFIPDVLDTGLGQNLLLCALAKLVGMKVNWPCTIVLYSGKFMLQTPDGKILIPDEDWRTLGEKKPDRYHVCAEQELIQTYLAQLHAACVIDNRPYDLCTFTNIMVEQCGGSLKDLPYPLGEKKEQ